MAFFRRDCPLCGAAPPNGLEIRSRTPAETLEFDQLRSAWRGFSRDAVFFSYARCGQCGLLFCPTYFDDEQLNDLYGLMPDNTDGVPLVTLRRTHAAYAVRLLAKGHKPGKVLDVGADIGLTSAEVRRLAPHAGITAVEPNAGVHEVLRENVPGVKVVEDLTSVDGSEGFDLVVAVHVLDHLLHLGQGVEAMSKLAARPGGSLGIVVHNEASLVRRGLGHRWPPFCLQHPQLFNPLTLSLLLEAHGWRNVSLHRTVNYFPVRHLGESLAAVTSVPERFVSLLPKKDVALPLGNVIAIADAG